MKQLQGLYKHSNQPSPINLLESQPSPPKKTVEEHMVCTIKQPSQQQQSTTDLPDVTLEPEPIPCEEEQSQPIQPRQETYVLKSSKSESESSIPEEEPQKEFCWI